MEKEELERVYFNCNHFFPASIEGPTEFGICLNDKEFSPFLDELLDNSNYACCQCLARITMRHYSKEITQLNTQSSAKSLFAAH